VTLEVINIILKHKSRLDPREVISYIFLEAHKIKRYFLVCYEIMA
jgi:hypothetical protein